MIIIPENSSFRVIRQIEEECTDYLYLGWDCLNLIPYFFNAVGNTVIVMTFLSNSVE